MDSVHSLLTPSFEHSSFTHFLPSSIALRFIYSSRNTKTRALVRPGLLRSDVSRQVLLLFTGVGLHLQEVHEHAHDISPCTAMCNLSTPVSSGACAGPPISRAARYSRCTDSITE